MRRLAWLILLCVITQFTAPLLQAQRGSRGIGNVDLLDLPKEARQTIALIKKGGPFPYKKDGAVFGNFERRLPLHERGYYKEFTVRSPGA
ncbi:MAG TPA: ribonuclease domain-containing protein, partial [Terriglobia bacterium]|nr:ribonuclease domain-containing protein [Terriglobia bacterium]